MEQSAAALPRQAAASAEAKKKPTTLLDAYEVECIRRELQRLVLKHNQSATGGDDSDTAPGAHAHGHHNSVGGGHLLHHHRVCSAKKAMTSAKRVSPSPPPSPPGPNKKDRSRGARLLGQHAVAICGGTVPLDGGSPIVGGQGRRRALAICSGAAAAAPVAGAPVGGGGRGKERAIALCSGTGSTAAVGCAGVGVDGRRRRRPRGGYYREVEKV